MIEAPRRPGFHASPKAAHRGNDLLGYVEVHIEQGPVLEDRRSSPVGVVSAIASQTRGRLTFSGKAGHAGTTPMNLRRDSLAGAAEWILFAEKLRRGARTARIPLVATVGTINVPSGAANVIPGETVLSLDVRHPSGSDAACQPGGEARLRRRGAARIARRRCGLALAMATDHAACTAPLRVLDRSSPACWQREFVRCDPGAESLAW